MEFDEDAEVWIRFKYGKRAMGLRRKNDKCLFLDENNRCSVYPSRPMTCRTFPYVIDYSDDGDIEVSLNDIVSCKCKKVPDTNLNEIIGLTITEDEEDEAYFKRIRNWNIKSELSGTDKFLAWCKL
jgi:Fe-S-cluster containining protein